MNENCRICDKQLIPVKGIGWIHPVNSGCSEDDGVMIVKQTRTLFDAKYGFPEKYFEDELNMKEMYVQELEGELDNLHQTIKDANEQNFAFQNLLGERTKELVKTRKTSLYYYMKRVGEWFKASKKATSSN